MITSSPERLRLFAILGEIGERRPKPRHGRWNAACPRLFRQPVRTVTPHDEASIAEVLEARRLRERSRELLRRSASIRQGLGEVVARITETREAVRRFRVQQAALADESRDETGMKGPA